MDPPAPEVVRRPISAARERNIAIHIFTASSGLVGVCLTVISIVHSFPAIQTAAPLADDLLAVTALMFLTACILSYVTLRSGVRKRMHRLESAADLVFLAGLGCMVLVCAVIVWAVF